jgi:hypothetical protein
MYELVHEEIHFDFEFGLRFSMVLGVLGWGNRRLGRLKISFMRL